MCKKLDDMDTGLNEEKQNPRNNSLLRENPSSQVKGAWEKRNYISSTVQDKYTCIETKFKYHDCVLIQNKALGSAQTLGHLKDSDLEDWRLR